MLTGRILLMLVVMTAMLATRQPAAVSSHASADQTALRVERTTWVQRLGTGVSRSFSRIGLMQRVALRSPLPPLCLTTGHTSRPAAVATPDPLRTCLPPPIA